MLHFLDHLRTVMGDLNTQGLTGLSTQEVGDWTMKNQDFIIKHIDRMGYIWIYIYIYISINP